jgi:HAD superfamily hydrolase (TIGR01490 family)
MKHSTGRPRFAFFDADGTLLRIRSLQAFEAFWQLHNGNVSAPCGTDVQRRQLAALDALPRRVANRTFFRGFAGRERIDVERCIAAFHGQLRRSGMPYFNDGPVAALRSLQRQGVAPVMVSGSLLELLQPFANELGIEHVLATRLRLAQDRYTGAILGAAMIGLGKQVAVRAFAARHGATLAECYAFGDHVSDVPMLRSVGFPVVVGDDDDIVQVAINNAWPRVG